MYIFIIIYRNQSNILPNDRYDRGGPSDLARYLQNSRVGR